ncbi:hypothetical protein PSTT_08900 [Puccinia striiformis]|uniref:Uncharacterized protein n=1 Tax=Puccinia striiformis TaxID=27350 RepID=A0A2S4VAH4_9BASI|nr:hypothetical protein PSTT_08900 [Puccinia striiformis]
MLLPQKKRSVVFARIDQVVTEFLISATKPFSSAFAAATKPLPAVYSSQSAALEPTYKNFAVLEPTNGSSAASEPSTTTSLQIIHPRSPTPLPQSPSQMDNIGFSATVDCTSTLGLNGEFIACGNSYTQDLFLPPGMEIPPTPLPNLPYNYYHQQTQHQHSFPNQMALNANSPNQMALDGNSFPDSHLSNDSAPHEDQPAASSTSRKKTISKLVLPQRSAPNNGTTLIKPKAPPRTQTAPHLVQQAQTKELDELIKLVAQNGQHNRLTASDELKLNNAYMHYQKQLYPLPTKTNSKWALVYSMPVKDQTREDLPTITTSAGTIQQPARFTMTRECAKLWSHVNQETKKQWKEPDFLETLPTILDPVDHDEDNDPSNGQKKRKKVVNFDTDRWAHKTVVDMRKLSRRYGIEGFLVIGSRGRDGTLKYDGGTHLGELFLDMFATDMSPVTRFIDLIRGYKVAKEITGTEPTINKQPQKTKTKPREIITIHDKGSKTNNVNFIRAKLNDAIEQVTHGKITLGWPGTNAQSTLTKHKVSLQVQDNNLTVTPHDFCMRPGDMGDPQAQQVVAALEENMVRLVGPPAPTKGPVGCILAAMDEQREGDGEGSSGGNSEGSSKQPTIIEVGRCKGKLRKVINRVKRTQSDLLPPSSPTAPANKKSKLNPPKTNSQTTGKKADSKGKGKSKYIAEIDDDLDEEEEEEEEYYEEED